MSRIICIKDYYEDGNLIYKKGETYMTQTIGRYWMFINELGLEDMVEKGEESPYFKVE